jgi:hypothetical protein
MVKAIKQIHRWWLNALYWAFDYQWVYLVRSTGTSLVKIGKGKHLATRVKQIDKSVKGSKEYCDFALKFFFGSKMERFFQGLVSKRNQTWKGSGKTEWHKTGTWGFRWAVRAYLKISFTIVWFLQSMAVVGFLWLLWAFYEQS